MISIISFLQAPIVLYTITLTIAWIFVQIASRISSKKLVLNINGYLAFTIFVVYLLLTVLFINVNVSCFLYLHALMLVLTLMMVSYSQKRMKLTFFITFVVALMPVLVMISTKHPFPLGDDARFIGFANAIDKDGRWIPYKYSENSYYQFFHLIPYLEYFLASIFGVDLENITVYYLVLKLCLYFLYPSLIYLIIKNLTGDKSSSLIAMLLSSITPPLAQTQVCLLYTSPSPRDRG